MCSSTVSSPCPDCAQDRKCVYKVTLRRVRETTVAVEKQKLLHIYVRARVGARACGRVVFLIQHATRMRHISL